ncbi:MAG TPA: hypothetical protein VFD43_06780 [Planctomycetota bacterium]|nr:hypothetical protein [Planctomycetota bacterium]
MPSDEAARASACGLAVGRDEYRPRQPGSTVLYQVVARHLRSLLARADHDSDRPGPLRFVRRAFTALLDCGILARGLLWVRCPQVGFRVVELTADGRIHDNTFDTDVAIRGLVLGGGLRF